MATTEDSFHNDLAEGGVSTGTDSNGNTFMQSSVIFKSTNKTLRAAIKKQSRITADFKAAVEEDEKVDTAEIMGIVEDDDDDSDDDAKSEVDLAPDDSDDDKDEENDIEKAMFEGKNNDQVNTMSIQTRAVVAGPAPTGIFDDIIDTIGDIVEKAADGISRTQKTSLKLGGGTISMVDFPTQDTTDVTYAGIDHGLDPRISQPEALRTLGTH